MTDYRPGSCIGKFGFILKRQDDNGRGRFPDSVSFIPEMGKYPVYACLDDIEDGRYMSYVKKEIVLPLFEKLNFRKQDVEIIYRGDHIVYRATVWASSLKYGGTV